MMTRNSKRKEAIFRVLRDTTFHPTAEQVYEQVRKEIPNISLGTVYRNLKLLKEAGRISILELADTLTRFDGNTQNHYHFECKQCGQVFDVDEPVAKELDERVARKTGNKAFYHRLVFYGLCKDCQKESNP